MFQHLSPQDTIAASKDGISHFSQLIQLAEQASHIYGNTNLCKNILVLYFLHRK